MLPLWSTTIDVLKRRLRLSSNGELGVAEIEADAELLRFLEEHGGLRPGHLALVPAVELRLVVDHPAREETGQRELGEDDQLGAARPSLPASSRAGARTQLARLSALAIGPIWAEATLTMRVIWNAPRSSR